MHELRFLLLIVLIAVQITRLYAYVEPLKSLCSLAEFEVNPALKRLLHRRDPYRDVPVKTMKQA